MKLEKGNSIINEPFWKHLNNGKEVIVNTYIKKEDISLTDFEIVSCNGNYKTALKLLLDKIERLPAADVRPVVRGKWQVYYTDLDSLYTRCTACLCTFKGSKNHYNFCPNCGAQMNMREEQR